MGLCCGSCCGSCDSEKRPMGYSGAAVLASATAPAREDSDGRMTLALPLHVCLPWKLSNLKCITVRGRVPVKPFRWKVELMNGGVGDDIALHIDVRHDLGYVVRNARLRGVWGTEELCGAPAMPFTPGGEFELTIFCAEDTFHMAVDGRHLASFRARSPLSAATTLHCHGTIELMGVSYAEDVQSYPPRPAPALAIAGKQGGYQRDNPVFPCHLPEPIQDGGEVKITGRVRMLPFSFYVDLRRGSQLYPEPDVLLHFNPRFQVNGSYDQIVVNSRAAGWGKEVRPKGFPFRAGRQFELRFVCETSSWNIFVDGVSLLKFPHRMSKTALDALDVRGDVIVDSLLFKSNSKDLIQL